MAMTYRLKRVLSGDTLVIECAKEVTVRLVGICAPHIDTPQGQDAKIALEELLVGKELVLQGRNIYVDGVDVADWLVDNGYTAKEDGG